MTFKKMAAAVAAVTLLSSLAVALPVGANAADAGTWSYDGYTYTTGAAKDTSMMYNSSRDFSNNNNVEIFYTDSSYSIGAYQFMIPATPEGKMIDSVSLRLVTERRKTDKPVHMYALDSSMFLNEYTSLSSAFSGTDASSFKSDVTKLTEITRFTPIKTGCALQYDTIPDEYQGIASWTNNITVAPSYVTPGSFSFVLAFTETSGGDATRFFTKEAVDVTNEKNSGLTFRREDLIPQLTLTYADIAATVTENGTTTNYSSLDAAITAANSASSDCTISLLADAAQTVKLNPNVRVTIEGNNYTITAAGTMYSAQPDGNKTITIKNATLNISGTSTSAPAFGTEWKDGSKITLNNVTVNADVVLYSINNSTLAVTGNSMINGTIYLFYGHYKEEAAHFRTYLDLNGYTGSGALDVQLVHNESNTNNVNSHYVANEFIMNHATVDIFRKVNFTDNEYTLKLDNNDLKLKLKTDADAVVNKFYTVSGTVANGAAAPTKIVVDSSAGKKQIGLDTAFNEGNVLLGIQLVNFPAAATIKSITLE